MDNTNWRAGGLEGRVSKWKTWIVGRLHRRQDRRASQRAVQKGSAAGCRKGQPSGPPFSAARRPPLMCNPPAIPVVQPASPLFYAARHPKDNSCFSFGNTALQPAGPPFSVIPIGGPWILCLIYQLGHLLRWNCWGTRMLGCNKQSD